jgi:hypothetical protein
MSTIMMVVLQSILIILDLKPIKLVEQLANLIYYQNINV